MKRFQIVEIITLLLVILFVYASVSKLADHNAFEAQIGRSPLISQFAGLFSWAVPIGELLIVVLLVSRKTVLLGLYSSFTLMLAFTVYIAFILTFSPYVPCSCGGILNKMGWTEHLIFNIVSTSLAALAVFLQTSREASDLPTIQDTSI